MWLLPALSKWGSAQKGFCFWPKNKTQINISRRWWDIRNIFPADPGCLAYRVNLQPWDCALEYLFDVIKMRQQYRSTFLALLSNISYNIQYNIQPPASAGWNSLWIHSENPVPHHKGGQMWLFGDFIYLFIWVADDKKRSGCRCCCCCCCVIVVCRGSWGCISSCLPSERVKGSGGAA